MANRPLKPCKYKGCKVLHRNVGLYCDEHQELHEKEMAVAKMKRRYARCKQYGYQLSDEEKFYSSSAWQKKRATIKEYQGFLCLNCLDNGIYKESEHIHHIVEVLEDWSKRFDNDNLIALCSECHKGVHILYKRGATERLETQAELLRILKKYYEGGYKIGRS